MPRVPVLLIVHCCAIGLAFGQDSGIGWKDSLAVDLRAGAPLEGTVTAHGGYVIEKQAASGTAVVAMPFPADRSHQQVLPHTLDVRLVDPGGQPLDAVVKKEIVRYQPHLPEKQLLHVTFDLSKLPSTAHFRWSVSIQLGKGVGPVPVDAAGASPADWLSDAPMIQTRDPGIVAAAQRIRASATPLGLAGATLNFMHGLRRYGQTELTQNDALSMLRTGIGDCVANANLFAALMRANGVPTRAVTGILRMSRGQYMHYQNEYRALNGGWIRVEPQSLQPQTSRANMVDMGLVYPQMEQVGYGFEYFNGVPMLSMAGVEIDANERPVPVANAKLRLAPGLLTIPSRSSLLYMHAAQPVQQARVPLFAPRANYYWRMPTVARPGLGRLSRQAAREGASMAQFFVAYAAKEAITRALGGEGVVDPRELVSRMTGRGFLTSVAAFTGISRGAEHVLTWAGVRASGPLTRAAVLDVVHGARSLGNVSRSLARGALPMSVAMMSLDVIAGRSPKQAAVTVMAYAGTGALIDLAIPLVLGRSVVGWVANVAVLTGKLLAGHYVDRRLQARWSPETPGREGLTGVVRRLAD
ncbi:MAG: transglutaminase domain-containing protein [Planctomycetes bacterium]|nr:transglutaminase domain-containing protein [Planctomycetota bacterium]